MAAASDGRRTFSRLLAPVVSVALAATAALAAVPSTAQAATAATATDSRGLAWGYNNYGELGDSTNISRSAPVAVMPGGGVTQVAAGNYHTAALLWNGEVRTWGANGNGQLGDGTKTDRPTPAPVSGLTGKFVQVAAGSSDTAAVRSDGTLWTWGYNQYGQLGDGTTTDRSEPVQVLNLAQVKQVSVNTVHTVALRSDGTVWTWGDNQFGELGDGTTTKRSTPVQVPGLTGVVEVAAGAWFTLALRSDGSVWGWGYNGYGQLGDGTNTNHATPARVTGLSKAVSVSAGYLSSAAVRSDGTVWTWGDNQFGELGDGTNTSRTTPVRVTGLSGVVQVSTGYSHDAAVRSDGSAWAWGYNGYGELGDGTTTDSTTPVAVSAGGITQVAVGGVHTVAVQALKPVDHALPTVSGTAANGRVLTAARGTWTGKGPISYAYQWQRCTADSSSCVNLSGATSTTYRLTHKDIGSRVRVRVYADNIGGTAGPVASKVTAVVKKAPPVKTKAPTVTGTKAKGKLLTAHAGTWTGVTPIHYAYQWQRCNSRGTGCASIHGAIHTTYRLAAADVGKRLRVNVTATNTDGHATAHSAVTTAIKKK